MYGSRTKKAHKGTTCKKITNFTSLSPTLSMFIFLLHHLHSPCTCQQNNNLSFTEYAKGSCINKITT